MRPFRTTLIRRSQLEESHLNPLSTNVIDDYLQSRPYHNTKLATLASAGDRFSNRTTSFCEDTCLGKQDQVPSTKCQVPFEAYQRKHAENNYLDVLDSMCRCVAWLQIYVFITRQTHQCSFVFLRPHVCR